MAQYDVKMSCGHVETVSLYGPVRERERKMEWMGRERLCRECYQAERERAAADAARQAAEQGLPALSGSPKQVAWAESIRADILAQCEAAVAKADKVAAERDLSEADEAELARIHAALDALRAEASAGWWIDHRGEGTLALRAKAPERR